MVVAITEEEKFVELVDKSKGYVFVDFFAEWCGPCKSFAPTFEQLSKEWTDVPFYKVDVDLLEDVAEENNIQSMPTFILYLDGREVDRLCGASKFKVLALLEKTKQAL